MQNWFNEMRSSKLRRAIRYPWERFVGIVVKSLISRCWQLGSCSSN